MAPDVGLALGARALWQEEQLLDFTIETEEMEFRVHKVVIASVSQYFKAMLTGGMLETGSNRVKLHGLRSDVVETLVNFMYTGEFGSDKVSADDLLHSAVYLQIPAAIIASADLLFQNMTIDNCFNALSLFITYSLKDYQDNTKEFIMSQMDKFLGTESPKELRYEDILVLIECWVNAEIDLLVLIERWIQLDVENRKTYANDLFNHLRFGLVSEGELVEFMKRDIYTHCEESLKAKIEEGLVYVKLPIEKKVIVETEQSTPRGEGSVAWFTSDSDYDSEIYVLRNEKKWLLSNTNRLPIIDETDVTFNNFFIISNYGQFAVFDPRTYKWSMFKGLESELKSYAFVYHEKNFYVLGGMLEEDPHYEKAILRYDQETMKWISTGQELPNAVRSIKALSIGGLIYVFGGVKKIEEDGIHYPPYMASERFDTYDPSTNIWQSRAPQILGDCFMAEPVEIEGEKVIAVFEYDDGSVCVYTPSTDLWTPYTYNNPIIATVTFDCIFAGKDCLYVLGYERNKGAAKNTKWTFNKENSTISETELASVSGPETLKCAALLAIANPRTSEKPANIRKDEGCQTSEELYFQYP